MKDQLVKRQRVDNGLMDQPVKDLAGAANLPVEELLFQIGLFAVKLLELGQQEIALAFRAGQFLLGGGNSRFEIGDIAAEIKSFFVQVLVLRFQASDLLVALDDLCGGGFGGSFGFGLKLGEGG